MASDLTELYELERRRGGLDNIDVNDPELVAIRQKIDGRGRVEPHDPDKYKGWDQAIYKLWKRGEPTSFIAAELGVSISWIYEALRRMHLTPNQRTVHSDVHIYKATKGRKTVYADTIRELGEKTGLRTYTGTTLIYIQTHGKKAGWTIEKGRWRKYDRFSQPGNRLRRM